MLQWGLLQPEDFKGAGKCLAEEKQGVDHDESLAQQLNEYAQKTFAKGFQHRLQACKCPRTRCQLSVEMIAKHYVNQLGKN